jgi:hypothetical protein
VEKIKTTGISMSSIFMSIISKRINYPKAWGRFHAWYNHELTNALPEWENEWGTWDHKETILPVLIIMCSLKQKAKDILWRSITMYLPLSPFGMEGEGDDMWLINGEKIPSLIGTGKEDF